MADYGTDVNAVLDRPDPETLATGTRNLANRLARRLLTTNGALTDIGDEAQYDTLNLRDWLAARPSGSDIGNLNTSMQQILAQDEEVDTVTASATWAAGVLSVTVNGVGSAGPFEFLLTIGDVSSAVLRVL